MTLTKADLIDSIYNQLNLPKTKSAELVESLLEIIKKALENGEDVLISGFGKFCVKDKRKRRGRNPQTGEDLMLGERRVVTFKCSGVLRSKINREGKGLSRRKNVR
ncbi:MAG: integration host factor subunit alpha [Deltaproteobacteria bacterium]|nr:MAG: integration host factor subunit alpha [Deltaproteobacteria bacterium]